MSTDNYTNETPVMEITSDRAIACLIFLFFMFSAASQAQVLYGSLTGSITDSSGAVVANAQVTAAEVRTGVSQVEKTDSSGNYRFLTLLPGTYKVTVSASGFSTQETPGVVVNVNEIARVNAALQVAGATQTVTVTTEAPLLQTDKADVHTDLTSQEIENLPTFGSQGRNFQALMKLVTGTGLIAETNSLAGNPQRAINVNVNGQSNQSVNYRIDGAQDAYPWLPANVAYVPPDDAIENANVATNNFDAEQGMAGGAAVNVQIKSGTNSFHGDVHEFHTDQNFQARNYFLTDPAFPQNVNIQNEFGGALGGPIRKNKLFFFADYERTTQRGKAGPDLRILPTPTMAQGDFRGLTDSSGKPIIIYDPMTGNTHGAGKQQISCNGVLNMICPNRIDPAATATIQLLQPAIAKEFQTTNPNVNNFAGSGTVLFNRDTADFKINYISSQNSSVFGRYSFSKTLAFDPPLLGSAIGDSTGGGQLGNAPGLIQSVGLGGTRTFTPTLLLDWNIGFTRQRLGSTFDLTSAKGLNDLKIPGTNNAGATGDPSLYYGLPGFTFATGLGLAALGNAQPANPFLFRDQQFVGGVNLNWIKGKHSLRAGMEWNHVQLNHFQPQGGTFQEPRGAFQFNGFATALQGSTPNLFNGWADFLLGLPGQTGKARALFNPTALRWSQWAWYAQDRWTLAPNLTLSLGVRWEYYPFGYSDNGKGLRNLNLNTGYVAIGGFGNVAQDDGVDTGIGQFLPRAGITYRLTSSTVVRGGYGMSADPYTWHVLRNAYPSVILDTNIGVTGNGADYVPAASLTGLNATGLGGGSYSVPVGITLAPLPNLSSGVIPLPTNVSTTAFANPFRRGYINSFNLMVEQDWKGLVLQTGYVGARAVRPVVNLNANASPPGAGSAGGILSQRYGKNYTGIINAIVPFKNATYDSLQTTVSRKFGNGSTANFAWTWGKAINYADNEDLGSLNFPYPAYWAKNRGPASFDRTHNFKIFGVLQSPVGNGQRWSSGRVGNWLLGGWQLSPIVSYYTGLPFTVTASGSLNAAGAFQTADLVGAFHIINGKPLRNQANGSNNCFQSNLGCHYFDPSAFAAPLITSNANTAHFGNTNRNEFRGPGYFEMDLSVAREFKLTERFVLQLRADAASLTNTPHFANPNAGPGTVGCPGSATTPGPVAGSGALCNTGANSTFGAITTTLQPGGFFGPDPGARTLWLGASVIF